MIDHCDELAARAGRQTDELAAARLEGEAKDGTGVRRQVADTSYLGGTS